MSRHASDCRKKASVPVPRVEVFVPPDESKYFVLGEMPRLTFSVVGLPYRVGLEVWNWVASNSPCLE
jgi:hypothetical protein